MDADGQETEKRKRFDSSDLDSSKQYDTEDTESQRLTKKQQKRRKQKAKSSTHVSMSGASVDTNEGSDAIDSQHKDEYRFNREMRCVHRKEKCIWYIDNMSVLSNNELAVVDSDNSSVKIIDIDKAEATQYMEFDDEPLDIATISNSEVAVTFQSEQLIRIITTIGGLSIKHSFKVTGSCLAVEYCNDKLYVSFCDPVKFQILTLTGDLIKTIQPDAHFLQQCSQPCNIAVHSTESKIYVSDNKNNVFLCMNMDGVMLHMYKDAGLDCPKAVCISPSGSIYLCNHTNNNIFKMADDLSEVSVILGSEDGLHMPQATCFCRGRKALYISTWRLHPGFVNVIKEFKYI